MSKKALEIFDKKDIIYLLNFCVKFQIYTTKSAV